MGEQPKKYHITDEGKIYRLDETGEITDIGSVDQLEKKGTNSSVNAKMPHKSRAKTPLKKSLEQKSTSRKSKSKDDNPIGCLIFILLIVGVCAAISFLSH